jgi:hypothetical protein
MPPQFVYPFPDRSDSRTDFIKHGQLLEARGNEALGYGEARERAAESPSPIVDCRGQCAGSARPSRKVR